jgi:hypothetical protein
MSNLDVQNINSKTGSSAISIADDGTATISNLGFSYTTNVISTNTNAASSNVYVFTASLTLTLPASPQVGDWIKVSDRSGTTTSVIGRNGNNIMGSATDLTIDVDNATLELAYVDAANGWVLL